MEKNKIAEGNDQKEAMAARVKDARIRILAEREDKKKGAVKLTNKLLKGVGYKEEIPVKLVTGDYGLLEINALGEGKIVEIFDEVGLANLQSSEEGFSKDQYNFFWSLVAASSGLDKKLIKKTFALGESAIVGQVILQISGFGDTAAEDVESFPE